MKTVAVIQARMGGHRFPNKIMAPLSGRPLLAHAIQAARVLVGGNEIYVATTHLAADDLTALWAEQLGATPFRGSVDNVYERFQRIAEATGAEYLIRICADCPIMELSLAYQLWQETVQKGADYGTFVTKSGIPTIQTTLGILPEVVSWAALETMPDTEQTTEHVTYELYSGTCYTNVHAAPLPERIPQHGLSLAIDLPGDLERVQWLLNAAGYADRWPHGVDRIVETLERHPELRLGGSIAKHYTGKRYASEAVS